MTPKQQAKKEGVSLSTIYRRHPVFKPLITPADIRVLQNSNMSIRDIAAMLDISKSTVHRWSKW